MTRWVLLRHDLPDGSWHHDLMIERDPRPSASLLSFRVAADVAWPPKAGFVATRIADHRRDYLSYEGPVSGNRGTVRRVGGGTCSVGVAGDELTIRLDGRDFHATPDDPVQRGNDESCQIWRFRPIGPNLED